VRFEALRTAIMTKTAFWKLTSSMKIPSLKRALDPLLRNASLLGQLGSTVCGRELVKNATY
jgi:hypothetical protein